MSLNADGNYAGGRSVVHVNGILLVAFAGLLAGADEVSWYGDRVIAQANQVPTARIDQAAALTRFGPGWDVHRDPAWCLYSARPTDTLLRLESLTGQSFLFAGGPEGSAVWAKEFNGYEDSTGFQTQDIVAVACDDLTGTLAVVDRATYSNLAFFDPRTSPRSRTPILGGDVAADRYTPQDLQFRDGVFSFRRQGQIVSVSL